MSESKQRWRLVFARGEEAEFLSHLDATHLWERAFRRGDIPVATTEGFSPRQRLVFGAPLQLGMLAEHELADLFLSERLTRPELRARLVDGMPRGYRLIGLHDVWVGAPALATQLVAADYRLTLLGAPADDLAGAGDTLLAASELKRQKHRDKKVVAYDLRPLLLDLRVREVDPATVGEGFVAGEAPVASVWMRLRNSQELGSGRPDEVVAAIGDELGMALIGLSGAGEETGEQDPAAPVRSSVGTAGDLAVGAAASVTPGAALEIIRPVRERLWGADELTV